MAVKPPEEQVKGENIMENRKIGALWVKKNDRGEFMTGEVEVNGEKIKIVVFKNEKLSDKHPDWAILKSREQ